MARGSYRVLQPQLLISLVAVPQPQRAHKCLLRLQAPAMACFVLMSAQDVCAVNLTAAEDDRATTACLCMSTSPSKHRQRTFPAHSILFLILGTDSRRKGFRYAVHMSQIQATPMISLQLRVWYAFHSASEAAKTRPCDTGGISLRSHESAAVDSHSY